ncbi:MAG: iron ABC transporter permease [Marinilabiliaceae bacterium]|nr:iron ABC transporter permease [Marinilabiliaceae bacterium]
MRFTLSISIIIISGIVLFILNIAVGTVFIPIRNVIEILSGDGLSPESWTIIVKNSRLPQALTALLAGSGLAVGGLQMQTLFRNPLADPTLIGVSSGAGLGVALVLMTSSFAGIVLSTTGFLGSLTITFAAFCGASISLFVILFLAGRLKNNVMLLIAGIMIGYVASSLISILNFYGMKDDVHSFVIWGLGSFSAVSWEKMLFFCPALLIGLFFSFLLIKPLNVLLLGENYAQNLGINIKRTRFIILLVTGLLTSVVTSFCGPISFLGLAVPHLTKGVLRTSNHLKLVPSVMLSGASLALLCNLISRLPGFDGTLPINAVTGIIGAPIVIWLLAKRKIG